MHSMRLLLLLILAGLALASPALARPDTVILVSIDGMRADYVDRGRTPALSALAAEGARAAMRPSYPSLTFPNHYTLVTGLRPDRNGVVDNTMDDPQIGHFTQAGSIDPRWWNEAEPLWVTADEQGLKTATMFWPGSDREIRGRRPDYWIAYDKTILADARVDQVLKWLDLPQVQRPSFITLYFDLVDTVGHHDGPDSPQLDDALASTDAAVGRLVAGLKARGLYDRTNLIVTADHGMAATSPDRIIYLDDVVPADAIRTVTVGASAGLALTPGAPADTLMRLLAIRDHARCWPKADLPAALHYGRNPRVPPVICLADAGWFITTRARMRALKSPFEKGAHGYSPEAPDMAALFLAHGPAFRKAASLPAFDNVDVQPLMAQLLGLKVQPGDGSAATFSDVLVH